MKLGKQTKQLIWTNGSRIHIWLINICMTYSYNCLIMTQDHGPFPLHTDVGGSQTVYRSPKYGPSWVPAYHWFQKHNVYTHWSSGKISRKCAEFLLFGCHIDLRSAKLKAQPVMGSLCWVQLIAKTSELSPLTATVWWNHSLLVAVLRPLLHTTIKARNCLQELVNTCETPIRRT